MSTSTLATHSMQAQSLSIDSSQPKPKHNSARFLIPETDVHSIIYEERMQVLRIEKDIQAHIEAINELRRKLFPSNDEVPPSAQYSSASIDTLEMKVLELRNKVSGAQIYEELGISDDAKLEMQSLLNNCAYETAPKRMTGSTKRIAGTKKPTESTHLDYPRLPWIGFAPALGLAFWRSNSASEDVEESFEKERMGALSSAYERIIGDGDLPGMGSGGQQMSDKLGKGEDVNTDGSKTTAYYVEPIEDLLKRYKKSRELLGDDLFKKEPGTTVSATLLKENPEDSSSSTSSSTKHAVLGRLLADPVEDSHTIDSMQTMDPVNPAASTTLGTQGPAASELSSSLQSPWTPLPSTEPPSATVPPVVSQSSPTAMQKSPQATSPLPNTRTPQLNSPPTNGDATQSSPISRLGLIMDPSHSTSSMGTFSNPIMRTSPNLRHYGSSIEPSHLSHALPSATSTLPSPPFESISHSMQQSLFESSTHSITVPDKYITGPMNGQSPLQSTPLPRPAYPFQPQAQEAPGTRAGSIAKPISTYGSLTSSSKASTYSVTSKSTLDESRHSSRMRPLSRVQEEKLAKSPYQPAVSAPRIRRAQAPPNTRPVFPTPINGSTLNQTSGPTSGRSLSESAPPTTPSTMSNTLPATSHSIARTQISRTQMALSQGYPSSNPNANTLTSSVGSRVHRHQRPLTTPHTPAHAQARAPVHVQQHPYMQYHPLSHPIGHDQGPLLASPPYIPPSSPMNQSIVSSRTPLNQSYSSVHSNLRTSNNIHQARVAVLQPNRTPNGTPNRTPSRSVTPTPSLPGTPASRSRYSSQPRSTSRATTPTYTVSAPSSGHPLSYELDRSSNSGDMYPNRLSEASVSAGSVSGRSQSGSTHTRFSSHSMPLSHASGYPTRRTPSSSTQPIPEGMLYAAQHHVAQPKYTISLGSYGLPTHVRPTDGSRKNTVYDDPKHPFYMPPSASKHASQRNHAGGNGPKRPNEDPIAAHAPSAPVSTTTPARVSILDRIKAQQQPSSRQQLGTNPPSAHRSNSRSQHASNPSVKWRPSPSENDATVLQPLSSSTNTVPPSTANSTRASNLSQSASRSRPQTTRPQVRFAVPAHHADHSAPSAATNTAPTIASTSSASPHPSRRAGTRIPFKGDAYIHPTSASHNAVTTSRVNTPTSTRMPTTPQATSRHPTSRNVSNYPQTPTSRYSTTPSSRYPTTPSYNPAPYSASVANAGSSAPTVGILYVPHGTSSPMDTAQGALLRSPPKPDALPPSRSRLRTSIAQPSF